MCVYVSSPILVILKVLLPYFSLNFKKIEDWKDRLQLILNENR